MQSRTENKQVAFSLSIAAAVAIWALPAQAEDPFASWQSVNEGLLFSERGGEVAVAVDDGALAAAVGLQHQVITNTFTVTGDVNGGSISAGNGTFAGQVLSLNVINTGNNVALQNQNVIAVTVVDSAVTVGTP